MAKEKKVNRKNLLSKLKQNLTDSESFTKEQGDRVKQWLKEFKGEPYGNEVEGKSTIVSKDIKKQAEWQHASLIEPFVSSPDIVKCSPITFEDKAAAEQNELVLNSQFCRGGLDFNRYKFMTKLIKVLQTEGTAIVRTSWEFEEEEVTVKEPVIQLNAEGIPILIGFKEKKQTKTIKNRPMAKVCRNEDVFIDPRVEDDVQKADFVIYRYKASLSELKQDGKYSDLDKITDGSQYGDDADSPEQRERESFEVEDKPRQKLDVYEYWGNYDVNGDGIAEPIVVTWVNSTIIRLEENPYPDKCIPFIIIPFIFTPFNIYGEANAEYIGDDQKTKTAMMRGVVDNMAQSNNAQKGMKKGSLDVVNKTKFLNGQNFEYNGNAADFIDGSYNDIPNSLFSFYEMVSNNIESMTGVKSFQGGIGGSSLGSTATAVNGVLGSTAKRELDIVRNIAENGIIPLLRKWTSYNSEFLEEEEVVRITNEQFSQIRRDDLQGNIDIQMTISTAETDNIKAQEIAFMMQTNAAAMDPELAQMMQAEIFRLRKMPDFAKKVETFKPTPDPMAQRMQELEMQKLEVEIADRMSRAKENEADYDLKVAKTQNELAKAGNMSSKTDLQDLDFLKKESGADIEDSMDLEDNKTKNQLALNSVNNKQQNNQSQQ